ncbi:hypothetical protein [Chromobacterium sp. LK11]|uniref:hypothetical protein n=1 Tax=Chromobacterium sp. LK11 TaxID=1628212 RepID=UPI00069E6E8B|nr:hypothetical protein [Chromobacterium sp. LK11]
MPAPSSLLPGLGLALYLLAVAASLLGGEARHGLLIAAAVGLIGWRLNYRHYRQIADTPTSRLASAALGQVELCGQARCHPGAPNHSPLSGRRCAWYRCWRIDERGKLDWEDWLTWAMQRSNRLATRTNPPAVSSDDSFLLVDGDAEATILPEAAQVAVRRRRRWHEDGMLLIEEWIDEGEAIYVRGQLRRLEPRASALDLRLDIGAKLAEWKHDKEDLLRRFDLDGDGQLSEQEWSLARAAAQGEVLALQQELARQPASLLLQGDDQGGPLIITTLSPQQSARLFRRRAWLHAAVALACALAWLKLTRF